MNRRLLIVQEYVPAYRVPFFEQLVGALREADVRTLVLSGQQAIHGRHDAVPPQPWERRVRQRSVTFAGRTLRSGPSVGALRNADAVVLPLLGSSGQAYRLLSNSRREQAVGLWGHVRPYVSRGNPLDLRLEAWQMRRADHVFAYTDSGAEYAAALGLQRNRLTSLRNTIDTEELERARAAVSDGEVERFRRSHSLHPDLTLGVIGALDEPKRIDFLVEALDRLWQVDRRVKLIVGGRGDQESLLEPARERGQAIVLGRVGAAEKALIAATASALVNPGRIGLIAVDALVLGLPVVTTPFAFHAPEADYLVEGQDRFTLSDEPRLYADELLALLGAGRLRAPSSAFPRLPEMVERFAGGVLTMIEHRANR